MHPKYSLNQYPLHEVPSGIVLAERKKWSRREAAKFMLWYLGEQDKRMSVFLEWSGSADLEQAIRVADSLMATQDLRAKDDCVNRLLINATGVVSDALQGVVGSDQIKNAIERVAGIGVPSRPALAVASDAAYAVAVLLKDVLPVLEWRPVTGAANVQCGLPALYGFGGTQNKEGEQSKKNMKMVGYCPLFIANVIANRWLRHEKAVVHSILEAWLKRI